MVRAWKEYSIYIRDTSLDDLGVKGHPERRKVNIDINSVSDFYESYHQVTNEEGTAVHLENGNDYFLLIPYRRFKDDVLGLRKSEKLQIFASKYGRNLNELEEAISDCSRWEFERIKSFGIIVLKEEDKIILIHKDRSSKVELTEDSIDNFIIALL